MLIALASCGSPVENTEVKPVNDTPAEQPAEDGTAEDEPSGSVQTDSGVLVVYFSRTG